MLGAIRKREILTHPLVTIQCFGWPVFLRALTAGPDETFLSLLAEPCAAGDSEVQSLLGGCAELERRAERAYLSLAERFADDAPARRFFDAIATQEKSHSEMLEVCRQAAADEGWTEARIGPLQERLPRTQQCLSDVEADTASLDSLHDALRLVLRLEGSEINQLFAGVIEATDSPFVRGIDVFRTAGVRHIEFICQHITELEPTLASSCAELRECVRPVRA